MTQVSAAEFSLQSGSDSTGWIDLRSTVADVCFNITGAWVGTIALQVSNQLDYTKTRYSQVTTYVANQAPLTLPRRLGRYFRFVFTAYTSGTAYIGFAPGVGSNNSLVDLAAQSNTSIPTDAF